jgi:hypothetical protein
MPGGERPVVAEWRVEVTAVLPTAAEYELEPVHYRLLRRHAGSGPAASL